LRKGSDGSKGPPGNSTITQHFRCLSATGGGDNTDKRGEGDSSPTKGASIEDDIDDYNATSGGFLSLVKGNNLTLNDYLQMMNTGLYNDFDDCEENDTEIEEYKNRNQRDEDDGYLSEESADQCMNKEEQENLF
jgi:hypothetical protein